MMARNPILEEIYKVREQTLGPGTGSWLRVDRWLLLALHRLVLPIPVGLGRLVLRPLLTSASPRVNCFILFQLFSRRCLLAGANDGPQAVGQISPDIWMRALFYLLIVGGGWLVALPAGLLYLECGAPYPGWNDQTYAVTGGACFAFGSGLASLSGYVLIRFGRGTPMPLTVRAV